MSYSLQAGAERDLADAMDFYAAHAGVLIARWFLTEFERVVQVLIEHPGLGTPTAKGRRTFPMQVSPYSLVYRESAAGIRPIRGRWTDSSGSRNHFTEAMSAPSTHHRKLPAH